MRVLITGVTGFAGGHLADFLLARGEREILGISRTGMWPSALAHLQGRVDIRACDLCDTGAVEKLLREAAPERIFHLAGFAHAGQSFRAAEAAWAGNLHATRALYDAVLRWGGRPRIIYVGSGLIYGDAKLSPGGFSEETTLRPVSPYAASKAAADLASYQYMRSAGLDIVRARPFNHTGPRQSPDYAVPNFARQIAAIERRLQPPVLETGNLSARRDLSDVRDVVAAYWSLGEQGRGGQAYNVASGVAHAMQTILDGLLRRTSARIQVRPGTNPPRATDTALVQGNAQRLRDETDWKPRYTLDQTLDDTLAYWRRALSE